MGSRVARRLAALAPLAGAACLVLALMSVPAAAASRARVDAVAARLRPPSCVPADSAADCPGEQAADFRQTIGRLLDQGLTPRQIVQRFVTGYGPQVLFVPPSGGADILIWVLPFGGVLLGGALWWRFVRRPRATAPPAAAEAATSGDADPVIDAELGDYL